MYFLYIKGRGYFNGYSSNYKWDEIVESDGIDTATGLPIHTTTYKICYNIKFIRDYSKVKPSATFKDEEHALSGIEEIKAIVGGDHGGRYKPRQHQCNNELHKVEYTIDVSPLEKALPKLVAFEEESHIINKKTNRLNIKRSMHYSSASGDNKVCSTCRISLAPDEPYVSFDGCTVCKHCLEQSWNHVSAEFEKHPMAEDITTAWQAEMVMREL